MVGVSGTQVAVCPDSCSSLDTINAQCQSQLRAIEQENSSAFAEWLSSFNCTSPETYLIPGLPPDIDNCLDAEDYCEYME